MASESNQLAVSGDAAALAEGSRREGRRRSEWRAGVRVLVRNRVALISLIFLALIHIVAIGYGPEADQAVLRQIASASQGVAIEVRDPRDIQRAFIQALQRF